MTVATEPQPVQSKPSDQAVASPAPSTSIERTWGEIAPEDQGATVEVRRPGQTATRSGVATRVTDKAVVIQPENGKPIGAKPSDVRVIDGSKKDPGALEPLEDNSADGGKAPGVTGSKLPASFQLPRAGQEAVRALHEHHLRTEQLRQELEAVLHDPGISVGEAIEKSHTLFAAIYEALKMAQQMIAFPKEQRGKVSVKPESNIPLHFANIVKDGLDIIAAYVHPDFLPSVGFYPAPKARSRYARGDVYLGTDATQRSVVHEVAHGIEAEHPEVLAACREFLAKRTVGESPEFLRDLTGDQTYSNERAYKDRWKELGGDDYTGKIDPDGTEILSTGITRLHSNPVEFARKDPEFFLFVVNTLRKW